MHFCCPRGEARLGAKMPPVLPRRAFLLLMCSESCHSIRLFAVECQINKLSFFRSAVGFLFFMSWKACAPLVTVADFCTLELAPHFQNSKFAASAPAFVNHPSSLLLLN